jgi:hypothetical protein
MVALGDDEERPIVTSTLDAKPASSRCIAGEVKLINQMRVSAVIHRDATFLSDETRILNLNMIPH